MKKKYAKRLLHGDSGTTFYGMWDNMKRRCDHPQHPSFPRYGGRGITYDPKWYEYIGFKEDMYCKFVEFVKNNPNSKPSIERLDNDGGYFKDNCTFIDILEQQKNTKKNKEFIAINLETGEEVISNNQDVFAREHRIPYSQSIRRVLKGKRRSTCGWTFRWRFK